MRLQFTDFTLELVHQFSISKFSRKTTPCILIKLENEGLCGYGEASLPQYLKENPGSVKNFLSKINSENLRDVSGINEIQEIVAGTGDGNYAAKAALDIALHDLIGKREQRPVFDLYGIENTGLQDTSFTIGIDTPEMIRRKIDEASGYKILKVKLGTGDDKNIIKIIREVTDKPVYADANGGWRNRDEALKLIEWLARQNVLLVEEPFPPESIDDIKWLKKNSPLPIIADESVQSAEDLCRAAELFHGINIKLMKCGGIGAAYNMINEARKLDLKIMLGCMTETSCGISAASQLAPLADWADLDGNLLIANDPFECETVKDGRIFLSGKSGLGLELINESILGQ